MMKKGARAQSTLSMPSMYICIFRGYCLGKRARARRFWNGIGLGEGTECQNIVRIRRSPMTCHDSFTGAAKLLFGGSDICREESRHATPLPCFLKMQSFLYTVASPVGAGGYPEAYFFEYFCDRYIDPRTAFPIENSGVVYTRVLYLSLDMIHSVTWRTFTSAILTQYEQHACAG